MSQQRAVAQSNTRKDNPELLFGVFERLLVRLLSEGVTALSLHPLTGCHVINGEERIHRAEFRLNASIIMAFLQGLVAEDQHRSLREVTKEDIRQVVGGSINHDVVLTQDGKHVVRSLTCQVADLERLGFQLDVKLEPPILAGYAQCVEVEKIVEAGSVGRWLEDFINRLFSLNPRPKDVIFTPNKRNPVVTVTGSVRAVEDVHFAEGCPVTQHLATYLLEVGLNRKQKQSLKDNEVLACIDFDLAFRTSTGHRCRVNIADSLDVQRNHAPLITMRLLHDKPLTAKALSLPDSVLDMAVRTRMGLVLICGSTGSGKSTSMGAVIDYLLKKKSINLLCLENPIETVFDPSDYPKSVISQRELGRHTESSDRGMLSAVRQTLNVAMVGEIRCAEDALMALDLAKTGHLIFATIHANSVGESIHRIVDMFPPEQEKKIRGMLAAHYKMGLAQMLIKGLWGQTELVMEIMKMSPVIQQCIAGEQKEGSRRSMRELLESSAAFGGCSMDQALVTLFKSGKINEDILMYNSPNPTDLIIRQNALGLKLSERWDPTGALISADLDGLKELSMSEFNVPLKL